MQAHIVPAGPGVPNDDSNVIMLCPTCHRRFDAARQAAEAGIADPHRQVCSATAPHRPIRSTRAAALLGVSGVSPAGGESLRPDPLDDSPGSTFVQSWLGPLADGSSRHLAVTGYVLDGSWRVAVFVDGLLTAHQSLQALGAP
jgi:hypothetical protein